MQRENISTRLDSFLFLAFIIFLVSLVFSLRAVSSIMIGLIFVIGLIRKERLKINFLNDKWSLVFLLGCSLLFAIQCFSSQYSKHVENTLRIVQRNSSLIFTPLAIVINREFFTEERYRKLIFYLAVILSIASVYCLGSAMIKYSTGSPYTVFFYHDLVKPLSQHAIQFSILIFSTLVFLLEHRKEANNGLTNFLRLPMIIFLSIFLILLSSKLIISFYVFYLLYFFSDNKINKNKSRILAICFAALITVIFLTPNPVSNRFRAIFAGNALLFEQKEFNPGIYFNGVQFRLVQWRFTYEILNEQHAWTGGLTPGDAQFFLNKKYIDTRMYTGIAGTKNHGFLGYHTHNQFLQIMLENGLPALVIFLLICYSLFKMSNTGQRRELKWLAALLLVYCFTDAPLQTQYGLIIFTFLPMLFHIRQESIKPKQGATTTNIEIQKTAYTLPGINFQKQPN